MIQKNFILKRDTFVSSHKDGRLNDKQLPKILGVVVTEESFKGNHTVFYGCVAV